MNWKQILKLSPEDLAEEEKDELLSTITTFDLDEEDIDLKKCTALLRISQEIMKYKSEQVDALLAELDEIAAKQGEEEAKKDSDVEIKSMRSKLSGGLDLEEIEHKYRDMKVKYKKLQKIAEKANDENERLKQNVKMLEKERQHLQNELQHTHQDESSSDISEIVKDQHKNLIDSVHQKNNQISQLLTDVENIESDNLVLRTKLTAVRDELADATDKMQVLTSETEIAKVRLQEMESIIATLQAENEGVKSQMNDILEDKKQRDTEFEEFVVEVDTRVEEWKKVLDDKNIEISHLKSKLPEVDMSRTSSSSSFKEDHSQLNALHGAVTNRDYQIRELQTQLETATKEMEETTKVIQKVTNERDLCVKNLQKHNTIIKDMKKQLKAAHNRCQELQEEVAYQESLVEMKTNEMHELLEKMRDGGSISDKDVYEQIYELKAQKRQKEKQISDLVRTSNKLQASVDNLEKENLTLRERLGLNEDDFVSTRSATSQQRRHRKLVEDLKNEIAGFEEERLEFRLEVQKLSKIIANLSDQILELGEKPNAEFVSDASKNDEVRKSGTETHLTKEVTIKSSDETLPKDLVKDFEVPKEKVDIQAGGDFITQDGKLEDANDSSVSREQYTVVIEENNALRKGLHEVLDSVHTKQETREIKSETLEKLLRALDVKHISGWYHPAMRLQAELHALQGSNSELRDQLRKTREELERYKEHIPQSLIEGGIMSQGSGSSSVVIANLNKHLVNVLKNYYLEEQTNSELVKKLETYKVEFQTIQQQVALLYSQYLQEKESWETRLEETDKLKLESEEKAAVLDAKLNTIVEYTDPKTDGDLKMKKLLEMASQVVLLNRKCIYLENQESVYREQIAALKEDILECESITLTKINLLNEENKNLLNKMKVNEAESNLDTREMEKVRNDYDNLLTKERQLLQAIEQVRAVNENENNLLNRRIELLEDEKKELESHLLDSLNNKYSTNDDANDLLSKKLAQSEVNEISERQRANHTNNLYELVKEQLQKSEDRYKEYQKYNNEIMHKNLILQESLKELENKITDYVDVGIFRNLEDDHIKLLKQQEKLQAEKEALDGELTLCRRNTETRKLWLDLERQEFLNLKHQIVDLQAASDDKTVIARLSYDVVIARAGEAETKRKLSECQLELKKVTVDNAELREVLDLEKEKFEKGTAGMEKKIRNLKSVIQQQRYHYIGYIPFVSEYKFAENIKRIYDDKRAAYNNLQHAEDLRNECEVLKHTLEAKNSILCDLQDLLDKRAEGVKMIDDWYQDRNELQLNELRYKKQTEFKEAQLQNALKRLSKQDEVLCDLEKELLLSLSIKEGPKGDSNKPVRDLRKSTATLVEITPAKDLRSVKNAEVQTYLDLENTMHQMVLNFEGQLSTLKIELEAKDNLIQQMRMKITDQEMNINMFRQQINDKQSQISFYENHIRETQMKKEAVTLGEDSGVSTASSANEEAVGLKSKLKECQDKLSDKENTIMKYQSLLKKDRDEHSLAAARFQEEIKQMQVRLARCEKEKEETKAVEQVPNRAAIEQYILQVHALEKHTAELHTSVTSLTSQLQSSREEAVRWRGLAYDRLQTMEELQIGLEEQHKNELHGYKSECEKWREEVKNLQEFIGKYKKDVSEMRPDIEKQIKEKDNKIHELMITVRQLKSGIKKKQASFVNQPSTSHDDNFDEIKEGLIREHDVLKKRFEQLLNKEKSARDEIRGLKNQLMKRPVLSARSDSSAGKEQQLQRKVTSQEREIEDLREKLEREAAANEAHKVKVNEDFERWSKLKHWQQAADKLKAKLKERNEEFEKVQQTCAGYRILIERLEREKYNLEGRIKNIKLHSSNVSVARSDLLESENAKLIFENESLREKLVAQHRHSGGLGAAMLQEKLEAQERKIAVLEMSAKGGMEVRSELDRLQTSNASLQKSNLRLEAENLELRLDLERSFKELPHLREQIVHLESYIEVLKSEQQQEHQVSCSGDNQNTSRPHEPKRVSELERTVFVLKRIVEKLQVENKRLQGGSSKPCSERLGSAERVKRDQKRLRDECAQAGRRICELERQLAEEKTNGNGAQLEEVQTQLRYKSDLLEKVKTLLQRAAGKEKALLEQVTSLKAMIPKELQDNETQHLVTNS